MTITAAVVMSLDAKLTRHNEPGVRSWASPEDQARFRQLVANHEVIIMGSHTYEAAREYLSLSMDIKRIVLTSRLQEFTGQ